MFREHRVVGAYLDLDGHFGNSLEDSRTFVAGLNQAIPPGCNINPDGDHADYLDSLKGNLAKLEGRLARREVHYVVFAHGADSHEDDDLGGQCTTAEWLDASHLVYDMLDRVGQQLGRPVPLTLALFGGIEVANNMAFQQAPEEVRRGAEKKPHIAVEVVPGADHFYTGVRDQAWQRWKGLLKKI